MKFATCLALLALVALVSADVYMHNPRGSNNRVNDNNQAPANRLFDSQNNNNAGYNSGDPTTNKMTFYAGSTLMFEWTAQHGCGPTNDKVSCEIVLQYMCDPNMRDGTTRNQPQTTVTVTDPVTGETTTTDAVPPFEPSLDRGRHENFSNWYECRRRDRNRGLFIADRNLNNEARATRQNNNGNRSGYECAEERDYYPYWHPTEWKDIAILTDNLTHCSMYEAESQNVVAKNYCTNIQENNENDCTGSGGTWAAAPAFGLNAPECLEAPWSRQNHHGNGVMPGNDAWRGSAMAHYNMTIPNEFGTACVIRMRYNMSTFDFDGWGIDHNSNGNASPVQQDPEIDIGVGTDLQLNVNTNQYGRTFEDRTHVLAIQPRPSSIPASATIWNMNVRGKRGNNQNTYPNCEYDFVPNKLHMEDDEWLHIQWAGSNNNPDGTDRHNIVQTADENSNYPLDLNDVTMFPDVATTTSLAISGTATDANLQDADTYYNMAPFTMQDGIYHFMSTKNNAFSNRSQKGVIIVGDGNYEEFSIGGGGLSTGGKVGIVVGAIAGGVVVIGGIGLAVVAFTGRSKSLGTTAGQAARF